MGVRGIATHATSYMAFFHNLYFCGGTLTTNRQPLAVSVVPSIGMLVNNFLLDWTTSSFAMYFRCLLGGSIVTIKMGMSTHSRLDVSCLRKIRESRWIRTPGTSYPLGMNLRVDSL